MVFELLTGDAEEKIREVAQDIKVVIANHKRQSQARKELIAKLEENIKSYSRGLQILIRRELVEVFGFLPIGVVGLRRMESVRSSVTQRIKADKSE